MSARWMTLPPFVMERLAACGVDADQALMRAGVPARPFHEGGNLRLSAAQFLAFWFAVEPLGAPPDMGINLVAQVPPDQYDVASIAALHSATFGEAIDRLVRYKRLTCPETIETERHGGELRLHFRWDAADAPQPPLLTDSAFAWIVLLAARGLGRAVKPLRLKLARRPQHRKLLADYFGCPIRFDAARDLIVFDAGLLQEPLRTQNAPLLAMLLPGLESALELHDAKRSLPEHVKTLLMRRMQGQRPNIGDIASAMCVSSRTLQRRLVEAGTSYQRLLDEVRQEVACGLLRGTDLETGEIAFFLGYEELNSFSRAFQGWEGMTPSRWREATRH